VLTQQLQEPIAESAQEDKYIHSIEINIKIDFYTVTIIIIIIIINKMCENLHTNAMYLVLVAAFMFIMA
jgi:hypothetical protein